MQILTKHYITISYINQLIPVSESDTTAPQIKEYSFRLNVFEKALLIFYGVIIEGLLLEDHCKLRALFIASCKVEHAVVGTHNLTREA